MSRQSDKARALLLDAAEELFARDGIDAVSNRRITEHAGTANHSAIKYHFGGREQLLQALLDRALSEMRDFAPRVAEKSDLGGGLREVVTTRVLPWIYSFDVQAPPAWRAQFLFQARLHPQLPAIVAGTLRAEGWLTDATGRSREELAGIPTAVIRARSSILGHMILGVCAQFERMVNEGDRRGTWESLGYFLIDAIVGMLAAPSTAAEEFLGFPDGA